MALACRTTCGGIRGINGRRSPNYRGRKERSWCDIERCRRRETETEAAEASQLEGKLHDVHKTFRLDICACSFYAIQRRHTPQHGWRTTLSAGYRSAVVHACSPIDRPPQWRSPTTAPFISCATKMYSRQWRPPSITARHAWSVDRCCAKDPSGSRCRLHWCPDLLDGNALQQFALKQRLCADHSCCCTGHR